MMPKRGEHAPTTTTVATKIKCQLNFNLYILNMARLKRKVSSGEERKEEGCDCEFDCHLTEGAVEVGYHRAYEGAHVAQRDHQILQKVGNSPQPHHGPKSTGNHQRYERLERDEQQRELHRRDRQLVADRHTSGPDEEHCQQRSEAHLQVIRRHPVSSPGLLTHFSTAKAL